ncbi:MAG: dephospho-CoA kinase [Deltaproteobacteria bacterium]|nr:dephospho-CoA kinase [Deltaproteobacteria bacterium]
MVILGLTGGIASGKSLVASMLAELGAAVVDADGIGHEIIEPGGAAYDAVVETFGNAALREDGTVDRTALAQIVFADADRRRLLEEITHPHIIDVMGQRIQEAINSGSKLIVVEAALIIEKGLDSLFTGVVVVYADETAQFERLMARNKLDAQEARRRVASQFPVLDKVAKADYCIDNSGTIENTRAQVIRMYFDIISPDTKLEKLRPPP